MGQSYLKWAEAEGRKIVDMAEGHKSFFAGKNFVFDPRRCFCAQATMPSGVRGDRAEHAV
jgi:hypothetical protein